MYCKDELHTFRRCLNVSNNDRRTKVGEEANALYLNYKSALFDYRPEVNSYPVRNNQYISGKRKLPLQPLSKDGRMLFALSQYATYGSVQMYSRTIRYLEFRPGMVVAYSPGLAEEVEVFYRQVNN